MVLGIGNNVEIVITARDQFSKVFNRAQLSMSKFRSTATAVAIVGAGIGVGFGLAIKAGIELETAMVGVAKTTGLAEDEIEGLRQEFIALSKEMPVSAEGLASIGEVAGQLGIVGTENIRSFTEVVAKMAIATELTEESAALALAKISNAMGLPIIEAEKLGSAINELSNISAASSSEIVSAMVRVSGSAKTLGISTDVVAGLTAALIAAGEPAERAGTKLRSAFDSVIKKIDDVEKFMPGFSDALRKDANGAILDLISTVAKIEDPIERQTIAMDLFGTVGASAVNKISNNLPEMNRLIEAASGQFENATSLQDEYNIALESTANQIQLAKNQFTALGIEIADALIPIIVDVLLPAFISIVNFFSNLPGPVKEAIVVLGLVTVAVSALAAVIAVITLISLPWLLIIGAIILAITGIILLIRNWDKVAGFLGEKIKEVTDSIKERFESVKAVIQTIIDLLLFAIKLVGKVTGISSVINLGGRAVSAIRNQSVEGSSSRQSFPIVQSNITIELDGEVINRTLSSTLNNQMNLR